MDTIPPVLDQLTAVVTQAVRDKVPFVDLVASLAWCLVSVAHGAGADRATFLICVAQTWDEATKGGEELLS